MATKKETKVKGSSRKRKLETIELKILKTKNCMYFNEHQINKIYN